MQQAVLDLGSNTFHLVLYEGEDPVPRRAWSETVRLGDAMVAGRITGAAFSRALGAVERLLGDLDGVSHGCPIATIATSALRAAENGDRFCQEIERRHGIAVEVLSGADEARLSYRGARGWLAGGGRLVVADLGGGSLELASGWGDSCDLAESLPIGVLGLRAAYVHPDRTLDPRARERIAATVRFTASDAARAIWDRRPDHLALTSGTARALGALADELGLRRAGSDEMGIETLRRLADVLSQFRPIELPALGVDEARSDTIAVGAVVLHTIMELLGFDTATISPSGLREGVALRQRDRPAPSVAEPRVHSAVT